MLMRHQPIAGLGRRTGRRAGYVERTTAFTILTRAPSSRLPTDSPFRPHPGPTHPGGEDPSAADRITGGYAASSAKGMWQRMV